MRTLTLDSSVTRNIKITITLLSLFFVASLLFSVEAQTSKGIRKKKEPPKFIQKRLALVIGNADYKTAPLRNPVNDARSMNRTLSDLGFSVDLVENATQKEMKKRIDLFGRKLQSVKGVGLFYFSGHGMQVNGQNYLIPLGANLDSEEDVEYESVNAGRIVAKMESARNLMNIIILDACRNNPFVRSFRSATQGLALLKPPAGTFIAYATSPGSVASDGLEESRNGLYTGELIKHMKTPGLKLEDVFKRVRSGVLRKSKRKQLPWDISLLEEGDFFFVPPIQGVGKVEKPLQNMTFYDDGVRDLMVVFKKEPDLKLENLMQNPRSKIYSGINSLVESIKSVNLKGFSEISTEDDFLRNLETMMTEKGSNSSLVFSTESIFQEDSESSMWEGTVLMNISIDSYLFKQDGLTKTGSYSIERQRIPIGKWGSSNSFKKKHLERITDKVIKKWSDENITNFIQSIK